MARLSTDNQEQNQEQVRSPVAAPEDDAGEFDELCLRQSPPLWLWVGIARRSRQVFVLALGDRTDETLARAWAQAPPYCRGRPVYTDH